MTGRALGPEELQRRLIQFGVGICRNVGKIRRSVVTAHVISQLIRSATAPAALYAEARAAESRRDFVHKMHLCLKELRESAVWLQFLNELAVTDPSRATIIQEAHELIAIFVASLKTIGSR